MKESRLNDLILSEACRCDVRSVQVILGMFSL